MMQKKIIKWLFFGMFILNGAGCVSHPIQTVLPPTESPLENSQDIFIDPSMVHFMGNTDHRKLQNLVATAQPTQFTRWSSDTTGAHFAFTSKEIFVNPEGQGCRNYEIKLIRSFFESPSFNATACRNSEGIWHMSHEGSCIGN